MRNALVIFLLLFYTCPGWSQELSNIRVRSITIHADSVQLDSLSIVPGSFHLYDEFESEIPASLYSLDHPRSLLRVEPELQNRDLSVLK